MPSESFWIWLSGFVDGEGCYTWRGPRNSFRLSIVNTNLPCLKEIQRTIGGTISTRNSQKYNPRAKQSYMIWWYRESCQKITRHIYPYLMIKNKQAKLILRAPVSKTGVKFNQDQRRLRTEIKAKLKKLNQKGVKV